MGLAIEVGVLQDALEGDAEWAAAIRKDVALINGLLADRGLPQHSEPEKLTGGVEYSSFPYSFLHHLRRAYVYMRAGKPVPSGKLTRKQERVVGKAYDKLAAHLMQHSDAEGYYVPVEFSDVIVHRVLPGAFLGSSQTLLRELDELRAPLGMPEDVPASVLDAWAESDMDAEFGVERIVWASLYRAARASVDQGCLIGFN